MSSQPFLRNIFTDLTGAIPNSQHYDKCGEMEMKMMECMEAYGLDKGLKVCTNYLQDFQECVGQRKQHMRFLTMRMERHKQYLRGELGEHYAPPPRVDAY